MATTTWTGSASNLWTDAANWTNGVPTYSTTPVINADNNDISIDLNGSQNTDSATTSGTKTVTFTNGKLGLNGNLTMAPGQNVVLSGSTLTGQKVTTSSGTATSGIITVTKGATIQFDEIDTTLNFGPASSSYTNTVNFTDGGKDIPVVTNLSPGDNIVFPNKDWNHGINFVETGKDSAGNTTYKINDGTNDSTPLVAKVTLAQGIKPSDFAWDDNKHAIVCFLAGSMIRTPKGDVAVEDIQIGDQVLTFDWRNNTEITQSIVWVGKVHHTVRPHLPDDQAGWPVRVLKDAIAGGVPYKDMLITAEHCLFFEGKFIPVRMLVNGRSIFYDKSISSYDYYHIETEKHSVITADGMFTESYLDTGNRRAFRQDGKVIAFTPSHNLSWDSDAAATLDVSRGIVEPLFRQVEARAEQAGLTRQDEPATLTDEADLHLVTSTGAVIRPARKADDRVIFCIPAGVKEVRLVSRASRPSDAIGPFVDDRRQLGVLVGDITLFESNQTTSITAHLTQDNLAGWNAMEGAPCRWTKGNALLPLGERAPNSVALFAVQIRGAGPYVLENATTAKAAIQA